MKHQFLPEYITKQYDVDTLKEIIRAFIGLQETLKLIIDDPTYMVSFNDNEISIGTNAKPRSSKVESLAITNYTSVEDMKDLLLKYPLAYECLNDYERSIFKSIFIDNMKESAVAIEIGIHNRVFQTAKESTIIKFCIKLGLDKFTKHFKALAK